MSLKVPFANYDASLYANAYAIAVTGVTIGCATHHLSLFDDL